MDIQDSFVLWGSLQSLEAKSGNCFNSHNGWGWYHPVGWTEHTNTLYQKCTKTVKFVILFLWCTSSHRLFRQHQYGRVLCWLRFKSNKGSYKREQTSQQKYSSSICPPARYPAKPWLIGSHRPDKSSLALTGTFQARCQRLARSCPQSNKKAACFQAISRRLANKKAFFSPQGALGWFNRSAMHSRTMSSNGGGHSLCQLTNVIYHLRQRLDIGASGWWKLLNIFFQDGLAETWQTDMFSWAGNLKVQSSSVEIR